MLRNALGEKKDLRVVLSAVCCGFLLSRGIAGGARSAGWDMPALMGDGGGSIWGAVLFGLACVICCIVRSDCGARSAAVMNCLTALLYTLHGMLSSDTAGAAYLLAGGMAVLAALVTVAERKTGAVQLSVLGLLLIPACVCPLPPAEPMLMMRLEAMSGVFSASCLCAAAIDALREQNTDRYRLSLVVGASLGIL